MKHIDKMEDLFKRYAVRTKDQELVLMHQCYYINQNTQLPTGSMDLHVAKCTLDVIKERIIGTMPGNHRVVSNVNLGETSIFAIPNQLNPKEIDVHIFLSQVKKNYLTSRLVPAFQYALHKAFNGSAFDFKPGRVILNIACITAPAKHALSGEYPQNDDRLKPYRIVDAVTELFRDTTDNHPIVIIAPTKLAITLPSDIVGTILGVEPSLFPPVRASQFLEMASKKIEIKCHDTIDSRLYLHNAHHFIFDVDKLNPAAFNMKSPPNNREIYLANHLVEASENLSLVLAYEFSKSVE